MATAVYLLCALASFSCALLLFREYWTYRAQAARLVLWSSISFACFAASNVLVLVDLVLAPNGRFTVMRAGTAAAATAVLLFGLIWETE